MPSYAITPAGQPRQLLARLTVRPGRGATLHLLGLARIALDTPPPRHIEALIDVSRYMLDTAGILPDIPAGRRARALCEALACTRLGTWATSITAAGYVVTQCVE